jgi:transcription termination factor NusB
MTANEYAEKVVRDFMREITDHVFLNIQTNEKLMRDYQTQVNKSGLQTVNQAIGRKVKEIFQLENDVICSAPKSGLIKDYTTFRRK